MTGIGDNVAFRGVRLVSTYTQVIDATPERVFPLLCPVREAAWVDGWVGRPVFAGSGVAEPDGVYVTQRAQQSPNTLWVVTRLDPTTRDVEFVGFVPRRQVFRLCIAVRSLDLHRSQVAIAYVRTGITTEGNTELEELRRTNGDAAMMREWELDMNHYLTTGRARHSAA